MTRSHPLLVAVPAFLLGASLVATLTTTAKAGPGLPSLAWEYKVVGGGEGDLNRLAAEGWEYCGESAAPTYGGASIERKYTMRKAR